MIFILNLISELKLEPKTFKVIEDWTDHEELMSLKIPSFGSLKKPLE